MPLKSQRLVWMVADVYKLEQMTARSIEDVNSCHERWLSLLLLFKRARKRQATFLYEIVMPNEDQDQDL